MEILTLLLVFFVAILAGFVAAWLYFSSKLNRVKETSAAALLQWQKEMNVAENKHVVATETLRLKTEELNKLYQENDKLTQTADERGMELAGLQIANIISADANVRVRIDKAININEASKNETIKIPSKGEKMTQKEKDDFVKEANRKMMEAYSNKVDKG